VFPEAFCLQGQTSDLKFHVQISFDRAMMMANKMAEKILRIALIAIALALINATKVTLYRPRF